MENDFSWSSGMLIYKKWYANQTIAPWQMNTSYDKLCPLKVIKISSHTSSSVLFTVCVADFLTGWHNFLATALSLCLATHSIFPPQAATSERALATSKWWKAGTTDCDSVFFRPRLIFMPGGYLRSNAHMHTWREGREEVAHLPLLPISCDFFEARRPRPDLIVDVTSRCVRIFCMMSLFFDQGKPLLYYTSWSIQIFFVHPYDFNILVLKYWVKRNWLNSHFRDLESSVTHSRNASVKTLPT